MNMLKIIVTITTLVLSSISKGDSKESCEDLYSKSLETDLYLTYELFDQTPANGFRKLAGQCPGEAVKLIKNYIIINEAKESSLRWHIAQLEGMMGNYQEAIIFANTVLTEQNTGQFKWNDFVEGKIAYWKQDFETLKDKIKILESNLDHRGNKMNVEILKGHLAEE